MDYFNLKKGVNKSVYWAVNNEIKNEWMRVGRSSWSSFVNFHTNKSQKSTNGFKNKQKMC